MNALLGLVRLHVNRRDVTTEWAKLLACAVTTEQTAWAARPKTIAGSGLALHC
jgi:hypothetical protein